MIQWLPHLNVSLNASTTVLLVIGFVLIKRGRKTAHKRVMLSALCVSTLFLVSYLVYHANVPSKRFPVDTAVAPAIARYFYLGLLATHSLMAASVPFLAIWTVYLGLKGKIAWHRRVAKWTWPIWLYVSVTGILVYLMLYQIYVPK